MERTAGQSIGARIVRSIRDPRGAAKDLLRLGQGRGAGALMALAAVLLTALVVQVEIVFYGLEELLRRSLPPEQANAELPPVSVPQFHLILALSLGSVYAFVVVFTHLAGAAFGGKGSLDDVSFLVGWWFLLLTGVQAISFVVITLGPPPIDALASVINLVLFFYFFWVLAAFAAEAHGFRAVPTVLFGGFGLAVGVFFVLRMIFVLL